MRINFNLRIKVTSSKDVAAFVAYYKTYNIHLNFEYSQLTL